MSNSGILSITKTALQQESLRLLREKDQSSFNTAAACFITTAILMLFSAAAAVKGAATGISIIFLISAVCNVVLGTIVYRRVSPLLKKLQRHEALTFDFNLRLETLQRLAQLPNVAEVPDDIVDLYRERRQELDEVTDGLEREIHLKKAAKLLAAPHTGMPSGKNPELLFVEREHLALHEEQLDKTIRRLEAEMLP